jgi:hypothetical protein
VGDRQILNARSEEVCLGTNLRATKSPHAADAGGEATKRCSDFTERPGPRGEIKVTDQIGDGYTRIPGRDGDLETKPRIGGASGKLLMNERACLDLYLAERL